MRACVVAILLAGCSSRSIREAAVEADAIGVMGIHPAADAAAIRGDAVSISVVFGENPPPRAPAVTISSGGRTWRPPCSLDETAGRWMSCAPLTDLPRGQVFDIELSTRRGESLIVSVDSELPEEPRAYRLNQLRVNRFGATRGAAEQLSELLSGSDLLLVTEGGSLEPGKHTLRMGLADKLGDEVFAVRSPGLTMVYDFVLSERLGGRPQDVFLPLQIDTEIVPLFLQDCTVKATVDDWRISDLAVKGTISALSLVQLTEPLGNLSGVALSRIELDVDTDRDGSPDAVSFQFTAEAPRVQLHGD